jgi:hypothetical protein
MKAKPVKPEKNNKIKKVTLTTGNIVSGKFITKSGRKFFEVGDTYYYLTAIHKIHD